MPALLRPLLTLMTAILLAVGLALGSPAHADGPVASASPVPIEVPEASKLRIPEGWMRQRGVFVDVHAPPRHQGLVEVLVAHADARVPELAARMGVPMGGRIHVFLASTDGQFRQVQPGAPPTWADATAYPGLGAIYLRAPLARQGDQEPLTTVLDHEVVHILLGRAFAPARPPTWVQEGLAQHYAEQHDFSTVQRLATVAATGPLPLHRLERGFPANPHAASLAYAQSADFFVWLEREHGPEAVPALIGGLARGASLTDAVEAATGATLYEVDRAWRARFQGWEGLALSSIHLTDGIWAVTAVLGIVAMFVVRRRQRRRRDAIAAREAAEDEAVLAAIWDGRLRPSRRPGPADGRWGPAERGWLLVEPPESGAG
jgi:hypothetical protein